MAMPKVDYFINTFDYFNKINGRPINGSVLDYGCNYGTFLDSSQGKFDQKDYIGLDIDQSALEEGIRMFPDATFIHYDKFNLCYNKTGIKNIWPNLGKKFNYIISYSVITHTDKEDMLDTIEWLYNLLDRNGKLLISYLSSDNNVAKRFFYNKRVKEFNQCDSILIKDFGYLVDNVLTKEKQIAKYFLSFYKDQYLEMLLAKYKPFLYRNNLFEEGCMQDCVVIKK